MHSVNEKNRDVLLIRRPGHNINFPNDLGRRALRDDSEMRSCGDVRVCVTLEVNAQQTHTHTHKAGIHTMWVNAPLHLDRDPSNIFTAQHNAPCDEIGIHGIFNNVIPLMHKCREQHNNTAATHKQKMTKI